MIYTITFNPSLDYIVQVDSFQTGKINKTRFEKILPGGKGINVSIVLANLGHASTAYGFLAGFTGDEIERRLQEFGCLCQFIHVKEGLSRINVKMKSDEETEINGMGPQIRSEDVDVLFSFLNQLQEMDTLVISGSIPACMDHDIYEKIMAFLQGRNIRIVVDATKDLLMSTLSYRPFLVKPNHLELSELFGVELHTKEDVIPYAKKLHELGALNVLVSMAKEGAVLVDASGKVYCKEAPQGQVVNSVGAGDSMVAGFLAGYAESNGDYEFALRKGICTGSASAFSENLATKAEVDTLLKQV